MTLSKHICTNRPNLNYGLVFPFIHSSSSPKVSPQAWKKCNICGFFADFPSFISLILLQTKTNSELIKANVQQKPLTNLLKMCTQAKWNKLLTQLIRSLTTGYYCSYLLGQSVWMFHNPQCQTTSVHHTLMTTFSKKGHIAECIFFYINYQV